MTKIDTSTEAVERLAQGLIAAFPIIEGYAGPYVDEQSLREDHDAASAVLLALLKECDEARARIEALEAFLANFAGAKFPLLPKPHVSHPADEPCPATDAEIVWAWQEDARDLLKGWV